MAILCSGCGRQLPRIPIRGKLPVLCAACAKLGERALLGGAPQGDDDDMATVDQPPPSSFRAPPGSSVPRPRSDMPPASVRASSSGAASSPRTMPAPPPGAPRPTPSTPPYASHAASAPHAPHAGGAASAPRPRAMPNAIPVAPPAPRIDRAVPRPSAQGESNEAAMMLTTGELEVISAADDELVLNTGDFEPVDTRKK